MGNTQKHGSFLRHKMMKEGLTEEMKLELGFKICDSAALTIVA